MNSPGHPQDVCANRNADSQHDITSVPQNMWVSTARTEDVCANHTWDGQSGPMHLQKMLARSRVHGRRSQRYQVQKMTVHGIKSRRCVCTVSSPEDVCSRDQVQKMCVHGIKSRRCLFKINHACPENVDTNTCSPDDAVVSQIVQASWTPFVL